MNFYLNLNIPVEESVKALAAQIVESAVLNCSSKELNDNEKIHLVRKKCKQIRALLRIVRPNIKTFYKEENIFFRDLSRNLSRIRDMQVYIETLKKIIKFSDISSNSETIENLIKIIIVQRDSIPFAKLIDEFSNEIQNSYKRIKLWKIKGNGFKCLEGGLKKTYRRGKFAMKVALQNPTAENYHEWRKRVKYHYHHLELLTPIWESLLEKYTEEVHLLSDLLGYDHDLSLLEPNIICNEKYDLSAEIKNQIIHSIYNKQEKLRLKTFNLGQKIYAEKPRYFIRRIEQYWNSRKS